MCILNFDYFIMFFYYIFSNPSYFVSITDFFTDCLDISFALSFLLFYFISFISANFYGVNLFFEKNYRTWVGSYYNILTVSLELSYLHCLKSTNWTMSLTLFPLLFNNGSISPSSLTIWLKSFYPSPRMIILSGRWEFLSIRSITASISCIWPSVSINMIMYWVKSEQKV